MSDNDKGQTSFWAKAVRGEGTHHAASVPATEADRFSEGYKHDLMQQLPHGTPNPGEDAAHSRKALEDMKARKLGGGQSR